jgi:LPXTG-motif cell wall-anchored protein
VRQHMRSHIRRSAAFVAAAAIAAAVPAVVAPAAYADETTGADLVISDLPTATPKPGELYDENVVITNSGTEAADGVSFRVRLTRGLDFPQHVEGCTYSTVKDQVRQAECEIDKVIEPGASIETAVRFKALPQALMEAVEYGTGRTGETPGDGFDNAYKRMTLDADSTADLVAIGDDTEALAGDKQSITVGLRNDGPGWIQNQKSDDLTALMVNIPKGTVATEVPKQCVPFGIDGPAGSDGQPGKSRYVCHPDDATFDVGETFTATFTLSIKAGTKTTTSEVKATSVYDIHPAFDKNPANDKAQIRIAIPTDNEDDPSTSGGSTTGGSADGGSGTGGNGNDPQGQSTGGTGTSGSSTSGTSTGGTTGSTDSTATGNLASTGSDGTPLIAGAAVATAGLGGLLVLAARRRRASAKAS